MDKKLSVLGFDLHGTLANQSSIKNSSKKTDTIGKVEGGTIYVSDEVIEEAFENIKATLDLVTICREINVIRYISSVILKEYQKGLIPLASLSKSIEDKKPFIETDKSNQVVPSSLFRAIATFATDLPSEEPENDL